MGQNCVGIGANLCPEALHVQGQPPNVGHSVEWQPGVNATAGSGVGQPAELVRIGDQIDLDDEPIGDGERRDE